MLPPDLHEAFASADERSDALQRLLARHRELEDVERLAALPADQWRPEDVQRFPAGASGNQEHPAHRLSRWHMLFADELHQLREARDAAVHMRIPDVELRIAAYLAGRLLAAAYGRNGDEVDALRQPG